MENSLSSFFGRDGLYSLAELTNLWQGSKHSNRTSGKAKLKMVNLAIGNFAVLLGKTISAEISKLVLFLHPPLNISRVRFMQIFYVLKTSFQTHLFLMQPFTPTT